jgi:hypothetical protein
MKGNFRGRMKKRVVLHSHHLGVVERKKYIKPFLRLEFYCYCTKITNFLEEKVTLAKARVVLKWRRKRMVSWWWWGLGRDSFVGRR